MLHFRKLGHFGSHHENTKSTVSRTIFTEIQNSKYFWDQRNKAVQMSIIMSYIASIRVFWVSPRKHKNYRISVNFRPNSKFKIFLKSAQRGGSNQYSDDMFSKFWNLAQNWVSQRKSGKSEIPPQKTQFLEIKTILLISRTRSSNI